MTALLVALQVAVAQPAPALTPVIQPAGRIVKILKTGDGRTEATAYKVKNVGEEYAVLRTFGFEPHVQSLVVEKDHRAYDTISAENPKTGEKAELWFDISSFFGKEF